MMLDGRAAEVIGVMPADFRFLDQKVDMYLPMRRDRNKVVLGNFSFSSIVRLKPGVTIAQANADAARMIPIGLASFPPFPGSSVKTFEQVKLAPDVKLLKDDLTGDVGKVLWVLMGTIGMVMLIACANVANLLLVRTEGRQHELAIRTALGASWGQIAGALMVESVALGIAGGAAGLGLAYGAVRLLRWMAPANLPRVNEISIDEGGAAVHRWRCRCWRAWCSGRCRGGGSTAGPRMAGSLRSGGRGSRADLGSSIGRGACW